MSKCSDDHGNDQHAWERTGLDNIDPDRLSPRPNVTLAPGFTDVLCNTRRCVWCNAREAKPYGNKGPWRRMR